MGWFKAGKNDRLANRDVLMHDDTALLGANDACHLVAGRDRHVPPTFSPRTNAARGPGFSKVLEPPIRFLRHGAKTVRDQIDSFVQDRKLTTPFEQLVSQQFLLRASDAHIN